MKIGMTAIIALALVAPAWAVDHSGPQTIQIRLTHPAPGKDRDRMEYVHQDDPNDAFTELVFVDRQAVANQSQIKSAKVVRYGDNEARVDVFLRGSQDEILRQDAGKHVAVVIDGQVWGVARLAPESTTEKLELAGDFTPQQATALSDKINQVAHEQ